MRKRELFTIAFLIMAPYLMGAFYAASFNLAYWQDGTKIFTIACWIFFGTFFAMFTLSNQVKP